MVASSLHPGKTGVTLKEHMLLKLNIEIPKIPFSMGLFGHTRKHHIA